MAPCERYCWEHVLHDHRQWNRTQIRTSKVKVSTLFPRWVSNGQVAPFATDLGIQLEEDSGDAIQDVEIDFTHMFGIRGTMHLMDKVQK